MKMLQTFSLSLNETNGTLKDNDEDNNSSGEDDHQYDRHEWGLGTHFKCRLGGGEALKGDITRW